ncbi:MAG: copper chaperone PCu(A)C [Geminicoccaceae bacterium]
MNRLALVGALTALTLIPPSSQAGEAGDLTIQDPWARETTANAQAGGAYFTIENSGSDPDRLTGAEAGIAERVELHTHEITDGVARMVSIDVIDVPGGDQVELAPGGLHIMLIGLNDPLVEGETFPLSLVFERAGTVEIEVAVKDIGHQGSGGHGSGHQMGHGNEGESENGGE